MSTPDTTPTSQNGALDPADYAHLPSHANGLRQFADRAGYKTAEHTGTMRKLIGDTRRREIVKLPDGQPQLGSRWLHVLTNDQVLTAQRDGLLNALMAGEDPDNPNG